MSPFLKVCGQIRSESVYPVFNLSPLSRIIPCDGQGCSGQDRRGREAASRTGEGRERPVTPAKIMKISKIALVAIKFVQFKISTAGYLYFCRWDDPTIGSRSGEG